MIGLRNILVHEYLKLDRAIGYKVLREDLGDFEKFVKAMSKFL